MALLDAALRTLAGHCADRGEPLPALRGARVTAQSVQILPDTPGPGPSPFTRDAGGGWWSLAAGTGLLDPAVAARMPAPYPALVTLGSGAGGEHVLADLHRLRALLVHGDAERARGIARAVALEAATSPTARGLDIITVGLGEDMPRLVPGARLRCLPSVRAAAGAIGEWLLTAHQQPSLPGPVPGLLVCTARTTGAQAAELADALAAAAVARLPAAAVLPAGSSGEIAALWPEAEHLTTSGELQQCRAVETPVRLTRVDEDTYQRLIAPLPGGPSHGPSGAAPPPPPQPTAAAPGAQAEAGQAPFPALLEAVGRTRPTTPPRGEPDPPAPPSTEQTPPAPAAAPPIQPDTPQADQLDALEDGQAPETLDPHAPELLLLGPVALSSSSEPGYRLDVLAALIYLRPGRSAEELCRAMDPERPWSRSTLHTRLSELRSRLGNDLSGDPYLPRGDRSHIRLSPAVRSDWTRFQHLARRGHHKGWPTGLRDLEAALALVRGRPLSLPSGDLPWAVPLAQEMTAAITAAAHTLATWHRTGTRDYTASRRAITTGLEVDDSAEVLYQDWMLLEDAMGHRPGVFSAIEALQVVLRRLDAPMHKNTEAVIDSILTPRAEGM